jgi:hypothetical protein
VTTLNTPCFTNLALKNTSVTTLYNRQNSGSKSIRCFVFNGDPTKISLQQVLVLTHTHSSWVQCCGSGSVSGSGLDPDSMESLDPYPDRDSQSGSGSRRANINQEIITVNKFNL